ncbi:MAG: hypothetical protein QMD92_04580 [bacterium]|nr:hypothetical protein [bacterium]
MKNRTLPILIAIFITLLYGYLTIYTLPSNTFFTMDNSIRFIHVQSILQNNFKDIYIKYPGEHLDPNFQFFPIRPPWKTLDLHIFIKNQKAYSMHPIAFPFLSTYFYKLFGYNGLYLIPILSSLVSLILIYLLANKIIPQYSLFSLLIMGLCSPLFFYSLLFWEYTLSIMISLLIFYLFCNNKAPSKFLYLFIGILLGINSWIRIETIILSIIIPFTFYFIYPKNTLNTRNVIFLIVGFTLSILPLILYNHWLYGSAISAHNKYVIKNVSDVQSISSFYSMLHDKLINFYRLWFNGAVSRINNAILFILTFAIFLFSIVQKYKKILLFLLILFLLNSLYICYRNYLHCITFITGLIPVVPYIIFILLVIKKLLQDNHTKYIKFILFSSLSYILFTSIIADSDGGNQWGPRYLLSVLPILIILSLYSLSIIKSSSSHPKIYQGIFFLLCLFSFFIQCAGFNLLFQGKKSQLVQLKTLENIKSKVVVSYSFGFSTENASLFYKKHFFWVKDQDSLEKLLSLFVKNKINNFCFVSFDESVIKKNKYKSLRWNFNKIIKEKGYKLNNKIFVSSWYVYNEFSYSL